MGCYGDGGAIFTDNAGLAQELKSIRVHGQGSDKYDNVRIGLNGRLDTIQAAVLLAKLEVFDGEVAARNRIAAIYEESLKGYVDCPQIPDEYRSSWAQYTIRLKNSAERAQVQEALRRNGIPAMVYYPKPLHLQKAFSQLDYRPGDLPVSEEAAEQVLSLPMHPYLSEVEIKTVAEAVVTALTKGQDCGIL